MEKERKILKRKLKKAFKEIKKYCAIGCNGCVLDPLCEIMPFYGISIEDILNPDRIMNIKNENEMIGTEGHLFINNE